MKITKYGQSTLLIEYKGKRILIDPGSYCSEDIDFGKVDVLLITHEHSDHFLPETIKVLFENNPELVMLSNKSVKALCEDEEIECDVLEVGEVRKFDDVSIKGIAQEHGDLPNGMPKPEVIGFLIDDKLYHTGDTIYQQEKPYADVVCVPICGVVVMNPSEAAKFAKEINPKLSIPVHYDNPRFPVDVNDFVKEMEGFNVKVLNNGESIEVE